MYNHKKYTYSLIFNIKLIVGVKSALEGTVNIAGSVLVANKTN